MKNKLNEIQKKMLKELNSMVKFYGKDTRKRALSKTGFCQYLTSTNKMCAIGRRLNEKDHEYIKSNEFNQGTGISEIYSDLTTKIIKDLPCEFWEDLQGFHDEEDCWNKRKGLSKMGLRYYQKIETKILNNEYPKS